LSLMLYHDRFSANTTKVEGFRLLGYNAVWSDRNSIDVSEKHVASIFSSLHNQR
jgi:hypothetical protein